MMKAANQKPGMMLYFSQWYAPLQLLNGEQVKELLCAVINLSENGERPKDFSDKAVEVFFKQMVTTILNDDEQYYKKVEQRKKAAQASVNARQRSLTVVNESQHSLTNADERQRLSTNPIQSNTIQSNTVQSSTDQYSSTQTKDKYWGDDKLWEQRCIHYGHDPYAPEQKAYYDNTWCKMASEDENSLAF